MGNEASQQDESEKITDEMLERAAEESEEVVEEQETEEEVVEEEQEPTEPAIPIEPEDNSERSQLGRKVKVLDENIKKITEVLERFSQTQASEPEEPEWPETQEELNALIDKRMAAKEAQKIEETEAQKKAYENSYIDTIQDFLEDEPEEARDKLIALLEKDCNIKHSTNGTKDAARNFLAAQKRLISGKAVPLKSEKPTAPLGGGGSTSVPQKKKALPKLDPDAKEYAERMGMSDEAILRALG